MYTIGEFAKLTNVTRKTLRHYDAIDLLKPSSIHPENGYRLYAIDQLDKMNTIQILKISGYELSKIKEFFEIYEPELLVELLDQKIKDIDTQVERLRDVQASLRRKSDIIKFGVSDVSISEFEIKELPERYVYRESIVGQDINKHFTLVVNKILGGRESILLHLSFIGLILPKDSFLNKDYEAHTHVIVFTERKSKDTFSIDAGKYLTVKHHGGYDSIRETYLKLFNHIRKNHYEVTGPSVDFGIVDTLIANDEERYITEIQVPIK